MIEVWPNLITLITFWTSFPKSKQPTCKSYGNICDAVQDPFMISKLTFFSFVCGLVKPYLKVFQSDHPMVPFIYSEVKSVIKSLLSLIVKPSIIEKSKTATDLKNINLSSEENLLPIKDVEMGFGVKNELKELIKKDNVSAKDVRKFFDESRSVICGIVIKLFERGPISCKMVRFTTVFDPAVFLTLDKSPLQKLLKGLLVSLMDHKILSSSQCDSVVVEFNNFYDNNFIMLRSFFEDFNEATDRFG